MLAGDPNAWYAYIQAMIIWLNGFTITVVLETLMACWIVLTALPNHIAGGLLFTNKNAWIIAAILTVIEFVLLVVPVVPWQLLIGILICGVFAAITYLLWAKEHRSAPAPVTP